MGLDRPGPEMSMGHSQPKGRTISELAEQLIEIEKAIPHQTAIKEERADEVASAQKAFDEADRRLTGLCQERNDLIKELSKFQRVGYEGDDK